MRTVLACCLVAAAAVPASDSPLALRQWTYQVDSEPLSEDDEDFGESLSDGHAGRDVAVAWQGASVLLTIDLGGWCELGGARVTRHFPTPAFRPGVVELAVRQHGAWQWINPAQRSVASRDKVDLTTVFELRRVRADGLQIYFRYVDKLALSEVQLTGTRLGSRPLEGWVVQATPAPEGGGPERLAALSDGRVGAAEALSWRAGDLRLELDLGTWTELRELVLNEHRSGRERSYRRLAISAETAGGWVERSVHEQADERAAGDPMLRVPLGPVRCRRLRLTFTGAERLALSELELHGQPVSGPATPGGSARDLPFLETTTATLRAVDIDADELSEQVLENAHLRLIVDPRTGVVRSLRRKPGGVELVDGGTPGQGLLQTLLPVTEAAGEAGPAGAWLELRLPEGGLGRRYRLESSSGRVRVDLLVVPAPGLTLRHHLGAVGVANRFMLPTPRGPREVATTVDGAGPAAALPEPVRGWVTVVGPGREGLALELPVERCAGLEFRPVAGGTAELTQRLTPGEPVSLWLTPFRGVESPVEVLAGVVIGLPISVVGERLFAGAELYAPAGAPATGVTAVLLPPAPGEPRELATAELQPATPLRLALEAKGLAAGVHLLRLDLSRGDRLLGRLERPIGIRRPSPALTVSRDSATGPDG